MHSEDSAFVEKRLTLHWNNLATLAYPVKRLIEHHHRIPRLEYWISEAISNCIRIEFTGTKLIPPCAFNDPVKRRPVPKTGYRAWSRPLLPPDKANLFRRDAAGDEGARDARDDSLPLARGNAFCKHHAYRFYSCHSSPPFSCAS
jgi:hypothetical protein